MITFTSSIIQKASETNNWQDTVVLTVDKIDENSYQLNIEVEKLTKIDLINALNEAVDMLEGNYL